MHPLARAVLCSAFLAVPIVAADALAQDFHTDTVDLQVAGNASVKGTIRGAEERESFLLRLPAGATVKASAKRKGKGSLVPLLDLVDEAMDVVATGTVKGKGSTLKTVPPVETSGDYRLRVFGDGTADGDYTLKIAVSTRGKWHGSGSATPAVVGLFYEFGAPAGAKAQIKLKPGRGSGFVPALDDLVGPDGYSEALSGTSAGPLTLGGAGTYAVNFHDGGAVGGEWVCDVKLKVLRVKKATVDISAGALTGQFDDDQPVFGRLVGEEGGLVDPPDLGGPLDGSSVDIPPGGLLFPVVISMHEADPFGLQGGDHPAGPAIDFGPSGTTFEPGHAATITIPYDPGEFTDPANEMHVYVLHDGVVSEVSPLSFPGPGLVSFPSTGFSTYVAGRNGPPPLRGDWAVVEMGFRTADDFGGNLELGSSQLTFDDRGDWTFQMQNTGAEWIRSFDDGVNPLHPAVNFSYDGGTQYGFSDVIDDTTVGVVEYESDATYFNRGPAGDVLLGIPGQGRDPRAQSTVALRLARGGATPLTLAGRWNVLVAGAGAQSGTPSATGAGGVDLYTSFGRGTMTLTADGKFSYSVTHTDARATLQDDATWTEKTAGERGNGAFTAFGTDVYLYLDGTGGGQVTGQAVGSRESGPPFHLRVCLDGDVLAGASDVYQDDAQVLLLVRAGSGFNANSLAGDTTAFGIYAERSAPGGPTGTPPYLTFGDMDTLVTHTPKRSVAFGAPEGMFYGYDGEGLSTAEILDVPGASATYTVSSDGSYRTSNGLYGAISRRRSLFVAAGVVDRRVVLNFAVPGVTFVVQ